LPVRKTKKAIALALAICLALAASWGPTQAQGGLRVVGSSVEARFPLALSFSISAESDVDITDIRLHYRVLGYSFADVTSETYIQFAPATSIVTSWDLDMRWIGGLPPGTDVEYWWTVEDVSGDRIETSPDIVKFSDERFAWRSLAEGRVTLRWYEGDQSFANEIMVVIQDGLAWLAEDTGAILLEPIDIYLYASAGDLRGSMIFPQEWTGGVAFTRYGCITIGISPDNLAWGMRALVHELTHLVVHQMTLNPYSGLPTWLDEGLAMLNEGPLAPQFAASLNRAIEEGGLISARSLSSPFSAYVEQSVLSYAQSYSLVEFLISNYGQGKMLGLLNTFSEGSSYDGSLEEAYGLDMDGLDILWRAHVTGRYPEAEVTTAVVLPARPSEERRMHPVLAGTLAGLATAVLFLLGLAAESWAWRRGR